MTRTNFTLILFSILVACASAQDATEGTIGDAQKLVKIRRVDVEGSRLPAPSVTRLAQIKIGDEVNFVKLHAALRNATRSGLIRNIEFEYESLPESEREVILHLKCTDETPSATASIRMPNVNEEEVWAWLAQVDPLFTRELPPNDAAIRLYSSWIVKFVEGHGDPKFQESFAVTTEGSSSTGGTVPDRLLFKAVKRRGLQELLEDLAHVVVMLDGDEAGRVAAEGISDRLQRLVYKVDVVELSYGMQPDQLSVDELHRLIDGMPVMR